MLERIFNYTCHRLANDIIFACIILFSNKGYSTCKSLRTTGLPQSCLLKCPIARHTQYDRHIQNIDISEMFNQTNPTVRTWSILGPWSLVIGHTYNTVTPTHTIDSFHSLQRSIFVLIRFIRCLIFALRAH